jgi:TonB-linked SusC/RagA family outer membrane protein
MIMIKNKQINTALCKLSFAIFMCIVTVPLLGQSLTVTGKVTDNNNKALPSVTVTVKGSATRALSNANGEYSINVPDKNVVLVFSSAGYATQEITAGDRTEINVSMSSQQRERGRNVDYVIEGVVVDETGQPFEGVTLYVKDKVSLGALSNSAGRFSIKASRGSVIVFSFVGYGDVEYIVSEEKRDLEIRLEPSAEEMDEVIVVGMGTQRKISALAAVTTVDTKELQVPAPSIANMLGGRVAGIITLQGSGEPGKNLAEFWVRGIGTFGANSSALVLIDGLEGNLNDIDPADVENFSILKDASATAVYGVRGANGVVLITTKRGETGKLRITGRANFSVSQVKRVPEYLRAYDYAMLVNEAHEVRGEDPIYDNVELNVIRDHLDPDLYPDVSWQDEILNKVSFKQTYFASVAGGGEIARYYASLGMSDETGAYKTEKGNPYATNAGYSTYTLRLNLDINLTKSTVLYFGSDAFMSINNLPGQVNTDYIWQAQSRLTPLMFPPRYSNGQFPAAGTSTDQISPYVQINYTGKHSDQNNKLKVTMALNQDLSGITEGLKIRLQGAYNRDGNLTETRSAMPALYRADPARSSRGLIVTKRIVEERKVTYSHSVQAYRKFHFEGTLNYDRVFGKRHRVGGLVYYYMSDQQNTKDMTSSSLSGVPVRYQGLSSRLTYGYKDTYMIDVNFGYTGSENFIPGQQFGFFPSLALGWSPSQYQWVKDNLKWITFFKIRGSHGTVGNDRIGGTSRFPYLTRVNTGSASPWGTLQSAEIVNISFMGADNLRWEKAVKSNIGIDAQFWNNKISFTADFFNDQRDGIFQPRVQVPDYIGLVSMPYGNVGKMKSWGSDGNISFTQDIAKDMSFTIRGNYTFSQNLVQNWEQVAENYPYKEYSGMPHNAVRGYQCLGFFKDMEDVKYSPVQTFGTVRPGDLKYKDVNGDGIVNGEDQVPIGFQSMYPLLMYGFGGEFRYKNFSVGILMKGTGQIDYFTNGWGYMPFMEQERGNVLAKFKDFSTRWIPMEYAITHGIDPSLAENPNAELPRLQYGNNGNNSQTSDFWKGDARYLRLQEVTIQYNLRNNFLRKMGISGIDLQLIGNNLYVWDKVKVFDPEQANRKGEVYPIPAVYSLQIYIRL